MISSAAEAPLDFEVRALSKGLHALMTAINSGTLGRKSNTTNIS
jgi:hypothetical protein